ncbi:TerD family protein [uncultured Selenomonas sp.]|uniref:TerD family protein n=1 Tax=uncultured Selenomonas sp. TaxID=159275 RepID=UPI0028DC946A|nr:TerD family protein [uncultured Selenomonas sp.]
MGVNLQKGQKVNLKKSDGQALSRIRIGLGWDPVKQGKKGGLFGSIFGGSAPDIDCDASVIACKGGRLSEKSDIVYFGNLKHPSGAICHTGDNLTGDGEGDDEQILVDLTAVPQDYDKLVFVVNIYDCESRKQDFGMIQNAFIRICDERTGEEFCRYDLSESYAGMTAMIFGEVYRHKGEWKFNAIGQGTKDTGLGALAGRYQ